MTTAWDSAGLHALLAEVGAEVGLSFAPHRNEMVRDDLERLRLQEGFESPQVMLQAVRASEEVRTRVLSALTVSETYFFREPAQFDFLRERILPERVAAAGQSGGLHIWSVGCATGEEPYSLAILLEEAGLAERAFLFASDVDEAALLRARRACYRPWSFRDVPEAVRARHFRSRDGEYELDPKLRSRVVFFPFNLASVDARRLWLGLWGLDVVLMRNVLIHLTEAAQRTAFQRVTNALAPGGWLLLAASDPPPPADLPLELVATRAGHVYRRLEPVERAPIRAPADSAEVRLSSLVAPAPRPSAPKTPRLDELLELAAREGPQAALTRIESAIEDEPLDVELRYARALLSLEARRPKDAADALRQVVYLDRTLPEAHFLTALVRAKAGDREGALRALDNTEELLAGRADDEVLPLGRGETVGALRVAALRVRLRLTPEVTR